MLQTCEDAPGRPGADAKGAEEGWRGVAVWSRRAPSPIPLDETDLPAIAAILAKYASLGIQLADASLVHLANREQIESIFTLDRRGFGALRLARGKKMRLIP